MNALRDLTRTFQIEGAPIRGRLIRLGPALRTALERHGPQDAAQGLIGETMALAAALAGGLKYDGVFTLQIQGDGPVGLVVCDVASGGDMRVCIKADEARLAAVDVEDHAPVPALLGAGQMAFTVDQGPDMERYQGVTALDGATLNECAHHFFQQSEQMPTALALASDRDGAAALALQRMPLSKVEDPDEADESWRRAVILMSSVTPDELLDPGLSAETLLFRLFHEDGVRLFDEKPLRWNCRCSRERVERTLASFDRAAVEEMADDGAVSVTCEFCKEAYVFGPAELDALYEG